jgi:two-component system, OmpR family, sensor histidine kinase CreC
MKLPFKFNISLKIFLGYFMLVGLAAWFVLNIFVEEVKPGVRDAMEDSLVDTANVLAELATADVRAERIESGDFAKSLAQYQKRTNKVKIWNVNKKIGDYRVYITDARGIVIFDSAKLALGQNYSKWNDVYLTLKGQYGVRSSLAVAGDKSSDTIMYVAAPIIENNKIIASLTVAKPNRTVLPFIARAQQKIILWGALLLVLSMLLGILFTWRFTTKIRKLRNYAIGVAKGEQVIAPTSSNDELAELAVAMQNMRSEIDGKQYVQDYVQHLTHELKSPITAIQGSLELISPDMPADTLMRFIAQIKAQTLRVQNIIQNMLGLATLEHQDKIQHKTDIQLNHLVQTQIQHLSSKAQKSNITFKFAETLPINILGDEFLLGQAIYNLLDNAVDFSPTNGVISVQLHDYQTYRQLSIRDTGVGVPDYALDKVFDKFYSLPRPNNNQKSTGLGLNFVKEVAKLHGGSVTLGNHEWGGAEAILTLPKN